MANMDAVLDFMFTNPTDENGVSSDKQIIKMCFAYTQYLCIGMQKYSWPVVTNT